MKRILHIVATPRGEESSTLKVSKIFLDGIKKRYPDYKIDELDLYSADLPALTVAMVAGKYVLLGGQGLTGSLKASWKPIEEHIGRFLTADHYIVSAPMWNFNIPYLLKQYIDIIVQPKYLFRYTATGVLGLVKNRKMTVITSRGGDYSAASPFHAFDYQEPYLRAIFGFVGITDIKFINAQPMNMGPDLQAKGLDKAKREAAELAEEV